MSSVSSTTHALHRVRPTTDVHDHHVDSSFMWDGNSGAVARPSSPSGFTTLESILARACRSHSWAYENGIVPVFDEHGQQVNYDARPPHPWEQLPRPRVMAAPRLYSTSEVDSWFRRVEARAKRLADAPGSKPNARSEVEP